MQVIAAQALLMELIRKELSPEASKLAKDVMRDIGEAPVKLTHAQQMHVRQLFVLYNTARRAALAIGHHSVEFQYDYLLAMMTLSSYILSTH